MNPRMYGVKANKTDGIKTIHEKKDYTVFQKGTVTEVTLGDSTFQVVDPHRIEQLFRELGELRSRITILQDELHKAHTANGIMYTEMNNMRNEIQKLKDDKNDGFGTREINI